MAVARVHYVAEKTRMENCLPVRNVAISFGINKSFIHLRLLMLYIQVESRAVLHPPALCST